MITIYSNEKLWNEMTKNGTKYTIDLDISIEQMNRFMDEHRFVSNNEFEGVYFIMINSISNIIMTRNFFKEFFPQLNLTYDRSSMLTTVTFTTKPSQTEGFNYSGLKIESDEQTEDFINKVKEYQSDSLTVVGIYEPKALSVNKLLFRYNHYEYRLPSVEMMTKIESALTKHEEKFYVYYQNEHKTKFVFIESNRDNPANKAFYFLNDFIIHTMPFPEQSIEDLTSFTSYTKKKALDNCKDELDRLSKTLEEFYDRAVEAGNRYESISKQKNMLEEALSISNEEDNKKLLEELNKFKEIDSFILQYPEYIFVTKPLLGLDSRTGLLHFLGSYKVSVNVNSGKIGFKNLMGSPTHNQGLHIYTDGSPCFGTLGPDMAKLISTVDLENITAYLLSFLTTPNVNDTFGTMIVLYPVFPRQNLESINLEEYNKALNRQSVTRKSGLFIEETMTQKLMISLWEKYYNETIEPNIDWVYKEKTSYDD